MEIFLLFGRLTALDVKPRVIYFSKQLYWLLAFMLAVWSEDVETLMQIVYDDQHLLPKHAHTLAGKATLRIIRRYVGRRYMTYRILHDMSAKFRHALYDLWLLFPELRKEVDGVRKLCAESRTVA